MSNLDGHKWNAYLQMCSYKGFATCVVEIAFHKKVEKVGSIATDGAQLGVTALENFVAERGTHVGPAIKEGARELEDMEMQLWGHFKSICGYQKITTTWVTTQFSPTQVNKHGVRYFTL